MSKKIPTTELTDEQRRKKNKRHNLIIYIIAGVLILAGAFIIINDQTLLFKRIENKITGEVAMPTLPPFPVYTVDPNATSVPRENDPNFTTVLPSETDTAKNTDPADEPSATPAQDSRVTAPPDATARPTSPASDPATPSPSVTPVPSNDNPYAPKYIHFVGYDISCPIDQVGLDANGQMVVVRNAYRAGWYRYGGDPVNGGNVIVAGHNRYSGKLGYFSVIKDKMKVGDMVIVEMQNGENAYYQVESINNYPYDDVPPAVMSTGGRPRLTLITCLGDYSFLIHTSRHRVIAVCTPVQFENP